MSNGESEQNVEEKRSEWIAKVVGQNRPKILPDILGFIGNTPLVKLNKIPLEEGVQCEVLAKCEYFNAGGSVKDRIAYRMIEEAEWAGKLRSGMTIIEPTSGNTGIGLALAAAVKGYQCIIVMPEKMSCEKFDVLRALGANVVRTSNDARFDSPYSHIGMAYRLHRETPGSVILNQYDNPGNPLAHYDTMADEILRDCDGKIDMIVVGVGTGGTVTGLGRKMHEKCPECKIIGVDPHGSILSDPDISTDGFYEVEGIGYDFVPNVLDRNVIDEWAKSTDKESFLMARRLIKQEGLLCGGSSGSIVCAAMLKAVNLRPDQRCVVILPDGVRNYMTKFLNDQWMRDRNFLCEPKPNTFWWSQLPVSRLSSATISPIIVGPDVLCHDAFELINHHGCCSRLPVVADDGLILGVVTLDDLMDPILKGKVSRKCTVKKVFSKNPSKVNLDTNLSELSKLLVKDDYALVLQEQRHFIDCSKSTAHLVIIGIVTRIDLLNFVTQNEVDKNEIGTPSSGFDSLSEEMNGISLENPRT